jgi:hypothetical protein
MSPVTPIGLNDALDRLKKRNTGRKPLTNYFRQSLDAVPNLRMFESGESVCFFFDEWDFVRFHFYSFDPAGLGTALQGLNWPPIVVGDWISKEGTSSVDMFLTNSGFHLHATYDRIIYKSLRRESTNVHLGFASPSDSEAIFALLFRVFDKYADHIMPLQELDQLIVREQVILSRGTDRLIDGLVILPTNGQNCNFNFLYSTGGSLNLSRLLGNFYGVLTDRGIQTGFSWVRRTRPLVLKLHQSFGWKTDGLVDYIYMRS